jgi:hypothetical protein
MYCNECGNKIEESDNFCGLCGTRLEQSVSALSETDDEIRFTWFTIKNDISGEKEKFRVNKYTFYNPILIGSGAECDVVLKSTGNSIIFRQHALLGHIGHHTYLRTRRDANGKIPAAVNEYGHLTNNEEGDRRLTSGSDEPGYEFRIGHYTIRMF